MIRRYSNRFAIRNRISSIRERIALRDTTVDTEAVRELVLFIENDGNLYRQMIQPTIKNLQRKVQRGVFDSELSVRAWQHIADEGVRRYDREFGSGRGSMTMLNKATRIEIAKTLAADFEEDVNEAKTASRRSAKNNINPYVSKVNAVLDKIKTKGTVKSVIDDIQEDSDIEGNPFVSWGGMVDFGKTEVLVTIIAGKSKYDSYISINMPKLKNDSIDFDIYWYQDLSEQEAMKKIDDCLNKLQSISKISSRVTYRNANRYSGRTAQKTHWEEIDNFPEWALYYVTYGNDDSLSEEDIKDINDWMEKNNIVSVNQKDSDEGASFSKKPAFGLGANVVTVNVEVKGEDMDTEKESKKEESKDTEKESKDSEKEESSDKKTSALEQNDKLYTDVKDMIKTNVDPDKQDEANRLLDSIFKKETKSAKTADLIVDGFLIHSTMTGINIVLTGKDRGELEKLGNEAARIYTEDEDSDNADEKFDKFCKENGLEICDDESGSLTEEDGDFYRYDGAKIRIIGKVSSRF